MTVKANAAKRPSIREGGISRSVFVGFNYALMFLMMLITLYPLYLTVIVSISNGMNVMRGEVSLRAEAPFVIR